MSTRQRADATEVQIDPIHAVDSSTIRAFFESLSPADRTFFREDVLRPGLIETWLRDSTTTKEMRFLASIDGEVVGYLAILPGHGWSSHVAEIRLVVHPSFRRRGVARVLARHAVVTSARAGITKLVVHVVSEQAATIAMFTALGFEAEGLLRDHVLGTSGEMFDLLVLSHFVDELYDSLTAAGVSGALTDG